MSVTRHRPWLGGVCAHLANCLGWNVYGIRAAAVFLAWLAPLATGLAYLLAAWWLRRDARPHRRSESVNPTMAEWDRRMADLDRDWERCQRH